MQRRQGFTITELLVSMALILFIMAILAEAFVVGLDSMRQLKAIGDMDAKLRSTITMMCYDLQSDHFNNGNRVSQQMAPPAQGFFRLFQGTPPVYEGSDPDGIPSTRAADSIMHFSMKLKGSRPENFFPTQIQAPGVPANYRSQWAEVAYFLRPTGTTAGKAPGALPLYSLHRRERVLYVPLPGQTDLNLLGNLLPISLLPQFWDVSVQPSLLNLLTIQFLNPSDITIPTNRFGMQPPNLLNLLDLVNAGLPLLPGNQYPALIDEPAQQAYWGADLVLTDVISFDVKISTGGDFIDLFDPTLSPLNPAFSGPGKPRVFDTWSSLKVTGLLGGLLGLGGVLDFSQWDVPGTPQSKPLQIQVKAIQVTIRIWDIKTLKARQVTFIQLV